MWAYKGFGSHKRFERQKVYMLLGCCSVDPPAPSCVLSPVTPCLFVLVVQVFLPPGVAIPAILIFFLLLMVVGLVCYTMLGLNLALLVCCYCSNQLFVQLLLVLVLARYCGCALGRCYWCLCRWSHWTHWSWRYCWYSFCLACSCSLR